MSILKMLFGKRKEPISKNLRMYSTRKMDNKTIFKIEKRQDFYKKFRVLLINMGFPDVETWHYDPSFNREFPIHKLVNFVDTFKNKNTEIDLVFTRDRIIIVLRSTEALRKKFIDELMNFCEWSEKKRKIEPLRKNF